MENIISVRNLNKRYGKKIILDNLNMNLKKGDIYGLVGKNGAGKTTLIRMILSLANIDSGEIELFGKIDEKEKLSEHKKIGNIIETPAFYSFFTAKQNLEYYRIQRGIVGEKSIDEVLEMVGLGDVGNKKFKKFSLGMKQRLGLALALLGEPELLILDEPTNGMDPMGIREVREVLLKLNKLDGVTILVSSHILGELSQLANCYGFLKDGKIVEEISEEELNEKCRHHLLIKVDDCKRASIILEQALKNNSYEILPDGFIKVYRELDNPQRINRALVEGGVDVYSLERVGVNLEDYFINLIGGENNA
ncbi:ATP-binding cassette domain-containing protein [Clostridium perfringens]|nr:ATP-binding cassette domain-containing protein [Clostridium perfringens]